jgi:hypothetical protein
MTPQDHKVSLCESGSGGLDKDWMLTALPDIAWRSLQDT